MEAEYVLSGDRHHFLICKAKLEAKYIFTPYGQEGGQISSHIVQKLKLVKTEEIRTPISSASFKTETQNERPRKSAAELNKFHAEYEFQINPAG